MLYFKKGYSNCNTIFDDLINTNLNEDKTTFTKCQFGAQKGQFRGF